MGRNTWFAKFKRTIGAFLPVAPDRKGQCLQCGACCCLPVRCLFLRARKDGKQYCLIYKFRPHNCRKYPRTPAEFITEETCGFYFESAQPSLVREALEKGMETPQFTF